MSQLTISRRANKKVRTSSREEKSDRGRLRSIHRGKATNDNRGAARVGQLRIDLIQKRHGEWMHVRFDTLSFDKLRRSSAETADTVTATTENHEPESPAHVGDAKS